MRRFPLIQTVSLAAATFVVSSHAHAQTACTTTGVTLKSFTPVDSLFPNPTATSFTIKLNNTVTGCPSEYRVSRFSDFRDASWLPYNTSPSIVVQRSSFPAVVDGATQITLYLQVRVKNPKAGFPMSVSGGTTQTQPDFFFSSVLNRRIRLIFFG